MTEELEQYILRHISPEPPHLAKLDRDTHLRSVYSHMCSGHLQGQLLKMLVTMINPRRVLELGTFTGYSAQCLAEGLLRPDAHIHTVEIDDEMEDFITEHLNTSPVAHRITLHIGDARDVVPKLGGEFDLVFIDANKRQYVDYYRLVMPYISDGGYLIADNTLWDGKVNSGERDALTQGIRDFNDLVAADNTVEKVILPLRDGLTIIRKPHNRDS